jgi:hypothetical protein
MLQKLRDWWNKDRRELAQEEGEMTEAERDVAEEDYESRKDDMSIGGTYEAGGIADYERDSEPPEGPGGGPPGDRAS